MILCLFLMGTSLVSAAEKFHDPAKGFKPAQSSLTSIMLQLAGSLEHHGSPEPYIRHIMAEHKRIDAKYAKATGKTKGSSRPAYLADKYVENLISNWKKLEKPLKLDELCRESGKNMRYAIQGSWNKTPDEWVAGEKHLNKQQRIRYLGLLRKKYFNREDLPEVDRFYADGGGWDKLSDDGKAQVSLRLHLGRAKSGQRKKYWKSRDGGTIIITIFNEYQDKLVTDLEKKDKGIVNSDTLESMLRKRLLLDGQQVDYSKLKWTEKDAIRHSHLIRVDFEKRFALVRRKLPKQQAEAVCGGVYSMVENLLAIAHSELRAAMREDVANRAIRKNKK